MVFRALKMALTTITIHFKIRNGIINIAIIFSLQICIIIPWYDALQQPRHIFGFLSLICYLRRYYLLTFQNKTQKNSDILFLHKKEDRLTFFFWPNKRSEKTSGTKRPFFQCVWTFHQWKHFGNNFSVLFHWHHVVLHSGLIMFELNVQLSMYC